jgi:hypothetical protein
VKVMHRGKASVEYRICAVHSSYDQILDQWLPHFCKDYKTFLAHLPSFLFLQDGVWYYVMDIAFHQCSVLIFHSSAINIVLLTIDVGGNWNTYLSISFPSASQKTHWRTVTEVSIEREYVHYCNSCLFTLVVLNYFVV